MYLVQFVEAQGGALLGGQAVGDAAGVGRDRPGDRVVGAGQLGAAGAGGGPAGVALAAGREQHPPETARAVAAERERKLGGSSWPWLPPELAGGPKRTIN